MDVFYYLIGIVILIIALLFPCKKQTVPISPVKPATQISATLIPATLPNCCQSKCGMLPNMYQPCDDPFSWGPTYSTGPRPHFFAFRRTPDTYN
jgi:hypothetical protein